MYYGVSWYPEHKDEAAWQHDLALLAKSGFNVVRMGEFAWTCLEPEPGRYDFAWLERAVAQLGGHGLKSILCTPTACPPAWLTGQHPDMLYVDNRGIRRPHGGRRSYCYTHEAYRRHAARIAGEIARRFGRNPAVLSFQLDNEPAQEGTGRCHCPACQAAFREWLRRRFGSIDQLNRAGGMVFWNQTYDRFEQITLPVNTIEVNTVDLIPAYYENPSLRLWAEQFASEQQIAFQNAQVVAMRDLTDKPITTNATGLATNSIDAYEACRDLDRYAFDYYPSLLQEISPAAYAFARGVKQQPFWLLEFVSGGGHRLNGSGRSQARPGALQQAVIHAAAHDAALVAHFQFRTFPFGAEQLNYALVDADGIPRRRYFECADTAELLSELDPWLGGSRLHSRVAILFSYESAWALNMKPVNPDFSPLAYLEQLTGELTALGLTPDILGIGQIPEDPEKYQLLILPALIILDPTQQQRIKQYVAAGGHVVASFLTSVKNGDNVGYTEPLPAGLQDLFGLTIAEVDPVFADTSDAIRPVRCETLADTDARTASWLECLALDGATAWAALTGGFRSGVPVVGRHAYGRGVAWYCGTRLTGDLARVFWQDVLSLAGIALPDLASPLPEGCQLIERQLTDGGVICFACNFTDRQQKLALTRPYELIARTRLDRTAQSPAIDPASCDGQVRLSSGLPGSDTVSCLELGPYRWALLRRV